MPGGASLLRASECLSRGSTQQYMVSPSSVMKDESTAAVLKRGSLVTSLRLKPPLTHSTEKYASSSCRWAPERFSTLPWSMRSDSRSSLVVTTSVASRREMRSSDMTSCWTMSMQQSCRIPVRLFTTFGSWFTVVTATHFAASSSATHFSPPSPAPSMEMIGSTRQSRMSLHQEVSLFTDCRPGVLTFSSMYTALAACCSASAPASCWLSACVSATRDQKTRSGSFWGSMKPRPWITDCSTSSL
mmetsp:Transcript_71043/g.200581  ORF Transcript_71043/g.200581 Transcript_71043/m.200581 type:complete len:244 (-) Transcript_71043:162-893(-)